MTMKAGVLGGLLPSRRSPTEQHHSLSTTSHLRPLWKRDSGTSHQPSLLPRFIPSISLENVQQVLAIQSASPWMTAHPTAESTSKSTQFIYFYACDVVAGVILTTQKSVFCCLAKAKSGWAIRVCFTAHSGMLLSTATYSAVLTVPPSGLCVHVSYHEQDSRVFK